MSQPQHLRSDYLYLQPVTTRWHDNDVYGHVNNVVYYSYFDSAVNTYLIEQGGLDIHNGEVIGFVVSSSFCRLLRPTRILSPAEEVNCLGLEARWNPGCFLPRFFR